MRACATSRTVSVPWVRRFELCDGASKYKICLGRIRRFIQRFWLPRLVKKALLYLQCLFQRCSLICSIWCFVSSLVKVLSGVWSSSSLLSRSFSHFLFLSWRPRLDPLSWELCLFELAGHSEPSHCKDLETRQWIWSSRSQTRMLVWPSLFLHLHH